MIFNSLWKKSKKSNFFRNNDKKVIQKSGWIFTANQQTQTLKENCK